MSDSENYDNIIVGWYRELVLDDGTIELQPKPMRSKELFIEKHKNATHVGAWRKVILTNTKLNIRYEG